MYCGLQQQAERVSLVCKALEYVGDIMKFIKPNMVNKSTEGLHITYWTLGVAQDTLGSENFPVTSDILGLNTLKISITDSLCCCFISIYYT